MIEAYRSTGQSQQAVRQAEALLQEPACQSPDRLLLQLADLYERDLLDLRLAQKNYETLLEKYPRSIYIEEARRRLRDLDKRLEPRPM